MSPSAEKSSEATETPPPPPPLASATNAASGSGEFPTSPEGSGSTTTPSLMPPGMAVPSHLAGMQFVPYFPPAATDPSDPNAQAQPQMMIHPAFLGQMYPYPYPGLLAAGLKTKRKQVKNACTNCQKACKKCDDERPCPRCVKYGVAEECTDSVRKERRKGIKRGSYKKKCKSVVSRHSVFSKLA